MADAETDVSISGADVLISSDTGAVRTLTLNRPQALNAFDEKAYDAAARAFRRAADDDAVAVVVLTGAGRAFGAGTDLTEMQARIGGDGFTPGEHGFPGLLEALADFPEPLIVAVNGVGLVSAQRFSGTRTSLSCHRPPGSSAHSPASASPPRRRRQTSCRS